MSFDLFLIAFCDGASALADAAKARSVLGQFRYVRHPEFRTFYDIRFDDGSHVELIARGLMDDDGPFDGGMFKLRGLNAPKAGFIFEFAHAAGCVIFPTMEPACVLLPRDDLRAHLPPDLSEEFQRVSLASGSELMTLLHGGLTAWQKYRDHVVDAAE